jgi:hypothetical protein
MNILNLIKKNIDFVKKKLKRSGQASEEVSTRGGLYNNVSARNWRFWEKGGKPSGKKNPEKNWQTHYQYYYYLGDKYKDFKARYGDPFYENVLKKIIPLLPNNGPSYYNHGLTSLIKHAYRSITATVTYIYTQCRLNPNMFVGAALIILVIFLLVAFKGDFGSGVFPIEGCADDTSHLSTSNEVPVKSSHKSNRQQFSYSFSFEEFHKIHQTRPHNCCRLAVHVDTVKTPFEWALGNFYGRNINVHHGYLEMVHNTISPPKLNVVWSHPILPRTLWRGPMTLEFPGGYNPATFFHAELKQVRA